MGSFGEWRNFVCLGSLLFSGIGIDGPINN